jgi:hypothetical protein
VQSIDLRRWNGKEIDSDRYEPLSYLRAIHF